MKNINFIFQAIRNRISSVHLHYKVLIALTVLTVLSIAGVGSISYRIASQEILEDAEQFVLSIEQQGSRTLEDRISEFEKSTYQVMQTESVQKVLNYSREEAQQYRARHEGISAAIVLESLLLTYTRYAALKAPSGMIYEYQRYNSDSAEHPTPESVFEKAETDLSMAHPFAWVRLDGKTCFMRKFVTPSLQEKGELFIWVDESFFDFMGNKISYLTDDSTLVLNRDGEVMKGSSQEPLQALVLAHLKAIDWDLRELEEEKRYTMDGNVYRLAASNTEKRDWILITYYPEDLVLAGVRRIFQAMGLLLVAALAAGIIFSMLLGKELIGNLQRIEKGLSEYEKGHFSYRIHPCCYDEIGMLGLEVNHMASRTGELIKEVQRKEEEKRSLEVQTLQAQINPHFLYNTLGSLKWSAVRNGQKDLADALDALVGLLRFTIKRAGGMVTVREEIEYIRHYENIEKMRYGDHFIIEYDIEPDSEQLMIPGFVLQPFVENSLLHGLDMTADDGYILIRTQITAGTQPYLIITVEDNGVGMTCQEAEALLQRTQEKKKNGFSSIGIQIVHIRLKEIYGDLYQTIIHSAPEEGCEVKLMIPLENKEG